MVPVKAVIVLNADQPPQPRATRKLSVVTSWGPRQLFLSQPGFSHIWLTVISQTVCHPPVPQPSGWTLTSCWPALDTRNKAGAGAAQTGPALRNQAVSEIHVLFLSLTPPFDS